HHAQARVHARAHPADLPARAHDAVARALAHAADADLALRAGDVDARGIDAVAGGAADLVGRAVELAALAALHARALVADEAGRADVALVDHAVAVVVEPVARLHRRLRELLAHRPVRRALREPRAADARLARVARLPAAGAGDAGQEEDVVVEVAVVV